MDEQRCAAESQDHQTHQKNVAIQEISSPIFQILTLKRAARMQRRKEDCTEQLPSWQHTSEIIEKHRK